MDTEDHLSSDNHIHSWIAVPFLNYVINGKGAPVGYKQGDLTAWDVHRPEIFGIIAERSEINPSHKYTLKKYF